MTTFSTLQHAMVPLLALFALASSAQATEQSSAAASSPEGRVLVLTFETADVDDVLAERCADAASVSLASRKGIKLISRKDLESIISLDEMKTALGCDQDVSCLVQVVAAAEADYLLAGSVGRIGRTFLASISLIHTAGVATARRLSAQANSEAALLEQCAALGTRVVLDAADTRSQRFQLDLEKKTTFAVFDLESAGLRPELAKNLTQVLSVEVKRIEGAAVIGWDDVVALLEFESQQAMQSCVDDASCLAEINAAMGVDKLIVGQVGKMAGTQVVSLRLLDAQRAAVESLAMETFTGPDDQLIGATRMAVLRLLGLEGKEVGELLVTSDQVGAQIHVDGELVGRTPMPPITGLSEGRHAVRVSKPRYLDANSDFYVLHGERTALWVDMVEDPATAGFRLPRWLFWSLVGVSGVGLGATGALAGGWALSQSSYDQLAAQSSRDHPASGPRMRLFGDLGSALGTAATVSMYTTLGLAGLSALSAIFVDWKSLGAADESTDGR